MTYKISQLYFRRDSVPFFRSRAEGVRGDYQIMQSEDGTYFLRYEQGCGGCSEGCYCDMSDSGFWKGFESTKDAEKVANEHNAKILEEHLIRLEVEEPS